MSLSQKQRMRKLSSLGVTAGALVLASAPGEAAIVQFTDRAAWEAAVDSHLTEDFNEIAPFRLLNTTTTSVGLLNITTVVPDGSTGFTRITDGTAPSAKNIDGTNFLNLQLDGTPKSLVAFECSGVPSSWRLRKFELDGTPKSLVAFEFSDPMLAWGVDYSFTEFGDAAELAFDDFITTFGSPGQSGFIGFISDTTFDRIEFKDPHFSFAAVGLDNVSFAQTTAAEPSSVPEPSAILGSLSALGLALAIKRQGSSSDSQ